MFFIPDEREDFFDNLAKSEESPVENFSATRAGEGRLAIDVYQIPGALVVRSTIAGAKIDDLDIIIDNGMLIIKGRRTEPEIVDYQDYLYRECYWGNFSRSIVLPVAVNEDEIEADLEEGVLTIILPLK